MLLLSPLIGRLHDRQHPFRFISASFGLLMAFPVLIVISSLWQGMPVVPVVIVFLAYTIFGIAMTGVNIAWNMGSIYYAGDQDASIYQSVHVTLTGIRGLIAPALGYALLKIFGLTAVFVVAAGFLCTASVISYRDYKRVSHSPQILAPDTP
jgi:predicted MFS family arabinose efflux permease